VSMGQGVRGDQAPAYWPWVQALRESLQDAPPESQSSIIEDGAIQLASLIPELRSAIRTVSTKALETSRTTRFLLFDGVRRFIKSVSRDAPICLLIDDLHFCDPGSLALFTHLTRELRDARVLIVGAFREAEVLASPHLSQTLSESALGDGCRILELTALP